MAILGLLLLLSAVGLTVDVLWLNTASISVDALGQTFSLDAGWLFVAGVATGAVGLLGVSMLLAGMTRARRRRAALVESRSSLESLQAERDRLAVELERQRARTVSDDESTVIDLDDERRTEGIAGDDTAVRGVAEEEPAIDRREPVGSGRHGLFHRRH